MRSRAMPPPALVDPAKIDTSEVLYDIEAIRGGNPQRFEMEQLTAVVHLDLDAGLIAGDKDVGPDEFWVRGHMPGSPLMPGVVMCEAAAQLCGFYCHVVDPAPGRYLGFGGMEGVRFRGSVRPGDRLVLVARAEKLPRRRMVFDAQGFVGPNMIFNGRLIGVLLADVSGAIGPR